MSFSQMLEMLQEENKGKIVLCNAGNFYIAVGKRSTKRRIETSNLILYNWTRV